jgi:hypothetical protein
MPRIAWFSLRFHTRSRIKETEMLSAIHKKLLSPEESPHSRSRAVLLFAAAFLALTFAGFRLIDDYDIWYHLAIGAETLKLRGVPATEFFLYPIMGTEASFHEWGFGLLFQIAHNLGGFPAMALLNAVLGSATLLILWRAAAVAEEAEAPGLLLLVPLFWIMEFRLVYRPEMFLFLALALAAYLLERWGKERRSRLLLPIPFLTMILGWFHPSALFMLGLIGCYGIQFCAEARKRGEPLAAVLGPLSIAAGTAAGTGCLNPYGLQQLLLPVHFAQHNEFLAVIEEFTPSLQSPLRGHFLAAAAVAAILLASRRVRLVDTLLICAFGYLAFRYVRNIPLFALALYLPACRALAAPLCRLPHSLVQGSALLLLAATAITSFRSAAWGFGPAPNLYPERSAAVMAAVRPPGLLFNSYESGGYLAWRLSGRYPVFTDGRHYTYDRTLRESNAILAASPEGASLMEHYGITAVITSPTFSGSGQLVPLAHELAQDPGWQLAAIEPAAVLFLRRDAVAGRADVPDLAPIGLWHLARRQAEEILAKNPAQAKALLTVATAYLKLGDTPRAIATLRVYVALVPADASTARALATLNQAGTH